MDSSPDPRDPPAPSAPPLVTESDLREIARWAAACAERALPIFEARAAGDRRPREAIAAAKCFAEEGRRTARLRALGWAAHAAAREVGEPAATAAARAAMMAAAAAYTHPIASPHQINHVLGAAAYAAHAHALATEGEGGAAGDIAAEAEIRRALAQASPAIRRIVRRLPGRAPSRGRLGALYYRLDASLRRE